MNFCRKEIALNGKQQIQDKWELEKAYKIRKKAFSFCGMQKKIVDMVGGKDTSYPPPQRIFHNNVG